MATKQQNVCHLLVLFLTIVIYSTTAQPAGPVPQIDSQEDIGPLDDPVQIDYRQFLNALQYNPPRALDESPDSVDDSPLDRHQLYRMLRSPLPAYPSAPQHHSVRYPSSSVMETANMSPGIKRFYEMYRMPDVKRQSRYRQCYFNPVACFK